MCRFSAKRRAYFKSRSLFQYILCVGLADKTTGKAIVLGPFQYILCVGLAELMGLNWSDVDLFQYILCVGLAETS